MFFFAAFISIISCLSGVNAAIGRYVRITAPHEYLQISQIALYAFGNTTNVAYKKPIHTDSYIPWWDCDVPRITDGALYNRRHPYSYHSRTHNQWIEIDLLKEYDLEKMIYWNRGDCCTYRSYWYYYTIYDADRALVCRHYFGQNGWAQTYYFNSHSCNDQRFARPYVWWHPSQTDWFAGTSSATPHIDNGITYQESNVFDGDSATWWNPTGLDMHNDYYMDVDFGKQTQLDVLAWENYGDCTHDPVSITLQFEHSGEYVDIATFSLTGCKSARQLIYIDRQFTTAHRTGQKLRIFIHALDLGYQPYIREIVFGSFEEPSVPTRGRYVRITNGYSLDILQLSQIAVYSKDDTATNIAYHKGVTIDGGGYYYVCAPAHAVDGTMGPRWFPHIYHNQVTQFAPWLEIDLGAEYDIDRLVFHGVLDICCQWRPAFYYWTVYDENHLPIMTKAFDSADLTQTYKIPMSTDAVVDTSAAVGRYIRIFAPSTYLQVAQLAVYGNGDPYTNLAYHKSTKTDKKGAYYRTDPSRAVDGSRTSRRHPFSYHSLSSNQWLQVDLGKEHKIDRIEYYNRAVAQSRSKEYVLSVYDENFSIVCAFAMNNVNNPVTFTTHLAENCNPRPYQNEYVYWYASRQSWYKGSSSGDFKVINDNSYDPSLLFDGNSDTFWDPFVTADESYYIDLDLVNQTQIDAVTWSNWGTCDNDPTSVTLQFNRTGEYEDFASFKLDACQKDPQLIYLTRQGNTTHRTGRFMKIKVTAPSAGSQPIVREVLFGTIAHPPGRTKAKFVRVTNGFAGLSTTNNRLGAASLTISQLVVTSFDNKNIARDHSSTSATYTIDEHGVNTYNSYASYPQKAFDGNLQSRSFQRTYRGNYPFYQTWMQVDLGDTFDIQTIIYYAQDDHDLRVRSAFLYFTLYDENMRAVMTFPLSSFARGKTFNLPVGVPELPDYSASVGRYVRFYTPNDYLQISQVAVYTAENPHENAAYMKPTRSSGDYAGTHHSNVVDGTLAARTYWFGYISSGHNGWWEVDLEANHNIQEVVYYNRGQGGAAYRATYMFMTVYNENMAIVCVEHLRLSDPRQKYSMTSCNPNPFGVPFAFWIKNQESWYQGVSSDTASRRLVSVPTSRMLSGEIVTDAPTVLPTVSPSAMPIFAPSPIPTVAPTAVPTLDPTYSPTFVPTDSPVPLTFYACSASYAQAYCGNAYENPDTGSWTVSGADNIHSAWLKLEVSPEYTGATVSAFSYRHRWYHGSDRCGACLVETNKDINVSLSNGYHEVFTLSNTDPDAQFFRFATPTENVQWMLISVLSVYSDHLGNGISDVKLFGIPTPTSQPSGQPSVAPSGEPSHPSSVPSGQPSLEPTSQPSLTTYDVSRMFDNKEHTYWNSSAAGSDDAFFDLDFGSEQKIDVIAWENYGQCDGHDANGAKVYFYRSATQEWEYSASFTLECRSDRQLVYLDSKTSIAGRTGQIMKIRVYSKEGHPCVRAIQFASYESDTPYVGVRYVRLTNGFKNSDAILQIAQLVVYAHGYSYNIAQWKPVEIDQGGVYSSWPAYRAVDGTQSPRYYPYLHHSIFSNPYRPFYEIDLQSEYFIQRISYYGSANTCCQWRTGFYYLTMYDEDKNPIMTKGFDTTATSAHFYFPTAAPTVHPTQAPTANPTTPFPTAIPTHKPSPVPTHYPTRDPTRRPTRRPTKAPTPVPTPVPTTATPTAVPTADPSVPYTRYLSIQFRVKYLYQDDFRRNKGAMMFSMQQTFMAILRLKINKVTRVRLLAERYDVLRVVVQVHRFAHLFDEAGPMDTMQRLTLNALFDGSLWELFKNETLALGGVVPEAAILLGSVATHVDT